MRKIYSFDIETFANTFSLVAKERDSGKYLEFILHEDDTLGHAHDLFLWLSEDPKLVGYNNLNFDGQIVEEIWKKQMVNGREIYAFAQRIIETKDQFKLPYKQWTFSHKHLDLMALNNFGIYGNKTTSLKWLEFTTRQQSIQDMPFHHSTELEPRQFDDLIRYNKRDVDMTHKFLELCRKGIDMRTKLSERFDDEIIMNQPNSAIGAKIVLYAYCDQTGLSPYKVKRLNTKRSQVKIADVILPYLNFNLPIFQEVKREFEGLVLRADKNGVINIKDVYKKEIEFQNMTIAYALGGIHGCVSSGIYHSSETHVIKTYDVTGMYPNLAIANRMYPEHLGEQFCDVFQLILDERKKYPKHEDLEMNTAYKEGANSVYGKSNAKHKNFLSDPRYTVQTTVNGQLMLTMLAEKLAEIGEFLMLNTDGSEILIPREKEEEYHRICDEWCKLTGIELEHDEYETMWIRDVNNYIARFASGKVKRKGAFCTYDDYIGIWNKNPSALIIPEAVNAYFLEGRDPSDTITDWGNIHDFLFGIKGGSTFEYWTVDIEDNTIQNIDRHDERAFRYYCSTEGKSILKNWTGGKNFGKLPSAVPNTKGQMIKPLMNIRDRKGEIFRKVRKNKQTFFENRYPDLDYEYYIRKAWAWINTIEQTDMVEEEELLIIKQ